MKADRDLDGPLAVALRRQFADAEDCIVDTTALSTTLALLRDAGVGPQAVARICFEALPPASGRDLWPAVAAIAEAAESSGVSLAYHNPHHTRDVAIFFTLLWILERQDLAPDHDGGRLPAIGLVAAFGHDVGHDGIGNRRPTGNGETVHEPFKLERIAASAVARALGDAGAGPQEVAGGVAAVLATDVTHGHAGLRRAIGDRTTGGVDPAGDLAPLGQPGYCRLAALLRDADLLGSAGLSPADFDRQSAALAAETGRPEMAGPGAADHFLRQITGRFLSRGGRHFGPMLSHLTALNDHRLSNPDLAPLNLEDVERRIRRV